MPEIIIDGANNNEKRNKIASGQLGFDLFA